MEDFYREYILDHYRKPRNFGHLAKPTISFEDRNILCGDEIRVELLVDAEGRVADVRFSGKGCAISLAATSMLTETLRGQELAAVAVIPKEWVLDELGLGLGITPARMKCALLGLKVVKSAALGEIARWPDEE
jgi:nitrogen fixation NifU-like protein